MISILNQSAWKILRLFYEDKIKKYHLREISRLVKVHEPAASKALNVLEKEKILKSEKDANLKKYYLRKTERVYSIFTVFDIERFDILPNIRKNAIKYYLNNLKEQPVFAILFGSTAKGSFRDESDMDVLLITNTKINTENAEKEADALTGIKISTFQMSYNNFLIELKMKDDKVVQSALNSGYPIINHVRYYEVLADERV